MHRFRAPLIAAAALAVGLAGCGGSSSTPTAPEAATDAVTDTPDVPRLGTDADALDETVIDIATVEGSEVRVDAKVASTDESRQRGLMGVAQLPAGAGMLFVFDEDRTGGFWMRDTLVPLDIAYITADGTIATTLAMDPCEAPEPADCPVYTPDTPYRAALEVPQGWFDAEGVAEGAAVRWSEPVPPS